MIIGMHELHGVSHEETAIGWQLCCHGCKHNCSGLENSPAGDVAVVVDSGETEGLVISSELNKKGDVKYGGYCFALMSHIF